MGKGHKSRQYVVNCSIRIQALALWCELHKSPLIILMAASRRFWVMKLSCRTLHRQTMCNNLQIIYNQIRRFLSAQQAWRILLLEAMGRHSSVIPVHLGAHLLARDWGSKLRNMLITKVQQMQVTTPQRHPNRWRIIRVEHPSRICWCIDEIWLLKRGWMNRESSQKWENSKCRNIW